MLFDDVMYTVETTDLPVWEIVASAATHAIYVKLYVVISENICLARSIKPLHSMATTTTHYNMKAFLHSVSKLHRENCNATWSLHIGELVKLVEVATMEAQLRRGKTRH